MKVFVFVFKYIQKVFDISNTIQIHFKYFVIFFNHILSSPAILLMCPIFYGLLLLVN